MELSFNALCTKYTKSDTISHTVWCQRAAFLITLLLYFTLITLLFNYFTALLITLSLITLLHSAHLKLPLFLLDLLPPPPPSAPSCRQKRCFQAALHPCQQRRLTKNQQPSSQVFFTVTALPQINKMSSKHSCVTWRLKTLHSPIQYHCSAIDVEW